MPKSKQSLSELLYDIRRIEEHREVLTEKKIKAIYRQLVDDLDSFLAKNYKKYADSDGRLYTAYLDEHRKRAAFLNEIIKNVDSIEPTLQKEITSLINETYKECYKGMVNAAKSAKNTQELAHITKDLSVRPEVLKQAVNNNISKLTLPAVLQKHRAEVIYQIQQELGVGLMNGDRYEKMAKRISERLDVSYSKAMNITRTETHRNIENGFMDCAEHIQEGMEGSGYIYAATWRTRLDERVRPQQRTKTKKGWKTTYSNNGANHMVMEGKTVKAGEPFDLGNGVKAKAPSQSGVAAHDCNCRCFLEYNLMTAEEFAKATGMTVKAVKEKYLTNYDKGGIMTSGAVSGALDSDSEEALQHATTYYESVRKMKMDAKRIAENTGFSESKIEEIKNYLFVSKHNLGGAEPEHFFPNYDISQSWQRLIDGKNIQAHDITLLRHEIMERKLVSQGYSQSEAHIMASKKYNYKKESDEYNAKVKEHKNNK